MRSCWRWWRRDSSSPSSCSVPPWASPTAGWPIAWKAPKAVSKPMRRPPEPVAADRRVAERPASRPAAGVITAAAPNLGTTQGTITGAEVERAADSGEVGVAAAGAGRITEPMSPGHPRMHARLHYPPSTRPSLIIENGSLYVLDLSERGLRYRQDVGPEPPIGAKLEGILRLSSGETLPVRGTVVRVTRPEGPGGP